MSVLPPMLPYLTVSDGAAAIEFYKKAFGAVEHELHLAPGSTKIMNACLSINGGVFMLSDDFSAQFGGASSTPEALGGSPLTLHLQVEDVDAAWAKAVAAGANVNEIDGGMTPLLIAVYRGDEDGQARFLREAPGPLGRRGEGNDARRA